eukprot:snap_masked-scaffold_2-processed-gene-14.16-mRNA-1 protein AED:0.05 eAED:0.11 QI:0/-1/0/1/-1/1/1/0/447
MYTPIQHNQPKLSGFSPLHLLKSQNRKYVISLTAIFFVFLLFNYNSNAPQTATPITSNGIIKQTSDSILQSLPLEQRQLLQKGIESEVNKLFQEKISTAIDSLNRQNQNKIYPPVKEIKTTDKKRIVVTGGAGFVGSHLVDRLMREGHEVIVLDNFFTGRRENVEQWIGHRNFRLVNHDVVMPYMVEADQIYHLACPASPPHYQYNPIKTIKTSTEGTLNMLGLAKRVKARMLLASTSEVYGDPLEHPQKETYFGNVNTLGPRACYDEGKRVAETMMVSYARQENVDIRIARIFNTFGPRMHPNDGRVVSNFIIQALQGKPITVYGSGKQTRSFQYVDDLVEGLYRLMNGNYSGPVNLGNPDEYSIEEFAFKIQSLVNPDSNVKYMDGTKDDPRKRKPDISLAKKELGWSPQVHVDDGLKKTVAYFRSELEKTGEFNPIMPAELDNQ